jgi:hypothetical protein
MRDQRGLGAHARRNGRGLGTCMTPANDNDIEGS